MIQRIQSLFLFLSGCGFGLEFLTNFFSTPSSYTGMLSDKILEIQDNPILIGLTIFGILISLLGIFLYTNRSLQQKLAVSSAFVGLLLPLVAGGLAYKELETTGIKDLIIQPQMGIFLPIISIVCGLLASKYIKKDEKLVRSMDRLR